MKKYLILGVNGMAGHMIAQYMIENNRSVTGFARKPSEICKTIIGDATKEELFEALYSDEYDVVVNAIGILNKNVDENEETGKYINGELPHIIAKKLENTKTKLIHISTDCVFDGERGAYREDDLPNAKSLYGITKSLGEVKDSRNLTIRTSIIGPELKSDGIGLFYWFMSQNTEVMGYRNAIWTGVTTLQLAKFICEDEQINITGLVHLCNNKKISKYELIGLFNKYCRKDKVDILEDYKVKVDKSLISTRKDFRYDVPDYEDMVVEMAEWIRQHPALYKQYLH